MPSHRVGFLCRFGLKTGIHFPHFGLESGMVFGGTTGVYERIYRFNCKWVRKKEKYANLKPICWVCFGLVWKRARKITFFWSEIGSGFGELGGTPPRRIPGSTPPPGYTVNSISADTFLKWIPKDGPCFFSVCSSYYPLGVQFSYTNCLNGGRKLKHVRT